MSLVIAVLVWFALVGIMLTTWPVEGLQANLIRGGSFALVALVVALFFEAVSRR